jgi:molecular chaperone DnaK
MEYALGLDLGGGPGAVAISRPESAQGHETEVLDVVGSRDRVDRLLDRLGDPLDMASGRDPVADELAGLVTAAIEAGRAARGTSPRSVVVAHPSSWGPYRVQLLRSALAGHTIPLELVPAAVAAVAAMTEPGAPAVTRAGDVVAVLDLRDEHVAVAVVSAGGDGGTGATVGVPRALTDLGALDLDDAVLAHARTVLADHAVEIIHADGARLREACAQAATELVTAAATTVTWQTGSGGHEVRVVASEVDARLRPRAARAIGAAADAVARDASAGVDRVLLVGRVAAMPLLTELVGERFEAPLTVLAGDSGAVARGAARLALTLPARTAAPGEPAAEPRAARGRRAHVQHAPRHPARVAAMLGTGVIALGVAALAVSGAALASASGPEDQSAGALPPAAVSVVDTPDGLPEIGSSGTATVLEPPSVLSGPVALGPYPERASDALAHAPAPLTGEPQASAG